MFVNNSGYKKPLSILAGVFKFYINNFTQQFKSNYPLGIAVIVKTMTNNATVSTIPTTMI